MSLPQYGSVRDPNKQGNNIQYQTYYRKHITGHEGEQQRYNRNSGQDRSNNVIAFQQVNTHDQIMNQIHM